MVLIPSNASCEATEYTDPVEDCVRIFEQHANGNIFLVEDCLLEAIYRRRLEYCSISEEKQPQLAEFCVLLEYRTRENCRGAKDERECLFTKTPDIRDPRFCELLGAGQECKSSLSIALDRLDLCSGQLKCTRYFAVKLRDPAICELRPWPSVDYQCIRETNHVIWQTPMRILCIVLMGVFLLSPLLIIVFFLKGVIPFGRFHRILSLVVIAGFSLSVAWCGFLLWAVTPVDNPAAGIVAFAPAACTLLFYSAWLFICLVQAQGSNKYVKNTLIVLDFVVPLLAALHLPSILVGERSFWKNLGGLLLATLLGSVILVTQACFLYNIGHFLLRGSQTGMTLVLIIASTPAICFALALLGIAIKALATKLNISAGLENSGQGS